MHHVGFGSALGLLASRTLGLAGEKTATPSQQGHASQQLNVHFWAKQGTAGLRGSSTHGQFPIGQTIFAGSVKRRESHTRGEGASQPMLQSGSRDSAADIPSINEMSSRATRSLCRPLLSISILSWQAPSGARASSGGTPRKISTSFAVWVNIPKPKPETRIPRL